MEDEYSFLSSEQKLALRAFDSAFPDEDRGCAGRALWQGYGMNWAFRDYLEDIKKRYEFTPIQQGSYDNLLKAFPEDGSGAKFKT